MSNSQPAQETWELYLDKWSDPERHVTRIMYIKNLVEQHLNTRQVIPEEHRSSIWRLIESLDKVMDQKKHKSIYRRCLKTQNLEIMSDVATDAVRTFPSADYKKKLLKKQNGSKTALYNVLKAYAIYNDEVQYTQGMNYLALVLLCYFKEEEAFWMMDVLIRGHGDYFFWGANRNGIVVLFQLSIALLKMLQKSLMTVGLNHFFEVVRTRIAKIDALELVQIAKNTFVSEETSKFLRDKLTALDVCDKIASPIIEGLKQGADIDMEPMELEEDPLDDGPLQDDNPPNILFLSDDESEEPEPQQPDGSDDDGWPDPDDLPNILFISDDESGDDEVDKTTSNHDRKGTLLPTVDLLIHKFIKFTLYCLTT
eukprot:gene14579-17239_t